MLDKKNLFIELLSTYLRNGDVNINFNNFIKINEIYYKVMKETIDKVKTTITIFGDDKTCNSLLQDINTYRNTLYNVWVKDGMPGSN